MNHSQIESTLLEALHAAGAHLKQAINRRGAIEKKSELSLVTETDKKAELAVIEVIRSQFADHALLTEESPPSGNSKSRWIVDPLDGTTNFAHTFPVAAVSIAFEHDGILEAGGVLDPFRDELFLGFRGRGATLNGRPIQVSPVKSLADSLLCTGFPYDRRERPDDYLRIFKAFMMKVQGIRRTGAAALDLCYVAAGRLDGFWEFQLQPWDKAAGMLIIREAGGKLSPFTGRELTLEDTQNVATNGHIHAEMLEVLAPFRDMQR